RINNLKLHRIPGRTISLADQAALAGGGNPGQLPFGAESEVDQLDVMDGDVGSRVAAGNPRGKLNAADLLGLQQRTVTVVDVAQNAVHNMGSKFLVVGIGELVIDDLGNDAARACQIIQLVELLQT